MFAPNSSMFVEANCVWTEDDAAHDYITPAGLLSEVINDRQRILSAITSAVKVADRQTKPMRSLYRKPRLHLEFKCHREHIRPAANSNPFHELKLCRFRTRQRLVPDAPVPGIRAGLAGKRKQPYSPVFCLSLLLAVGLIIEICH